MVDPMGVLNTPGCTMELSVPGKTDIPPTRAEDLKKSLRDAFEMFECFEFFFFMADS
jgi:hypothetical protein